MANTLVSIGNLGSFRVYLNLSVEDAKERYQQETDLDPDDCNVDEFEFEDVFYSYEVGPVEDSIVAGEKG